MQPESIVDIDELLALDRPEVVADYFNGLEGKINWISKFNGQSFNGHFDGNGATVYGLYATTDGTSREDVGLFPQYDGGTKVGSKLVSNVCKNIAVKNSYFYSKRRLGAIFGACYTTNYGAKIDGKIFVDTCAVVNCYMLGAGGGSYTWSFFSEQGVISGGGSGDNIILNNILVKDVYAYNNQLSAIINIVGNGSTKKAKEQYQNTVSNSIILGTAPYGVDYYSQTVHEPYLYTNVVTDFPTGVVDLATPTWSNTTTQKDYTDRIFSITETGYAFKQAATMLDWKNTWFMGKNGPELQVFHDGLKLVTTNTTHTWICDCCDTETVEGTQPHNFVLDGTTVKGDGSDVYKCTGCDYVCQHNEQTPPEYDSGDCVTKAGVYTRCKFCDWYLTEDLTAAPGHKLTFVEMVAPNCAKNGCAEYWYCSVCNNKFASNDAFAPMEYALSDEQLDLGIGDHVAPDVNGGAVYVSDENGHWYACVVDGGRLDAHGNFLGDDGFISHDKSAFVAYGDSGHTINCSSCNYTSKGIVAHKYRFGICKYCSWECTEHNYVNSKIIQQLSCTADKIAQKTCSICGIIDTVTIKEAIGHCFNDNGNCTVCGVKNNDDYDLAYPLNGKYDADYTEVSGTGISYVTVNYSVKNVIDKFTGYDVEFCINPNTQGTGTAGNPYVIKTANQFAAVVTCNLIDENGNWIDTEGLYFKIADNIYGFDLNNTGSSTNFNNTMTASQVESALENASVISGLEWQNNSYKVFKGSFDGNGACVFGLKATGAYAGIFPRIGGNITVKNLTVKNCYFKGENVSAFFASNSNPDSKTSLNTQHNMYNCQAYGNVLICTYVYNEAIQKCGIFIAQTTGHTPAGSTWKNTESKLVVNDCLVYDNIAKHIENDDFDPNNRYITYGLVGNLHRSGSLTINNSIIMDSAPHALYYGSNAHQTSSYHNLYTNAIGYRWENYDIASNTTSYRYVYEYTVDANGTLRVRFNHYDKTGNNLTNNGNGYDKVLSGSKVYVKTADQIKRSYELEGISSERWTYNSNGYPTPKIYKVREYSAGANWSGEQAIQYGEGDGTQYAPYTIATAEELALMLTKPVTGAYYKLVADIAINDTTADDWTKSAKTWFTSNDVPVFEASLDGNGHTVSGIYYDGTQAGESVGFIPVVGNTAEIKNITIANSLINANNGSAGAVAGSVADKCGKVVKFNTITIDDSVVFSGNADFGGIIGTVGYSVVNINDCISKSNGFFANVIGEAKVNRCISVGAQPFGDAANVIAKGVYTDVETTLDGVIVVANEKMTGLTASMNMPELDFPYSWKSVDGSYPVPTGLAIAAEGAVGEVWSGAIATKYAGGSGTKDDPYLIETAEQLAKLVTTTYRPKPTTVGNEAMTAEELMQWNIDHIKYYKLTADIYVNDVNSKLWKEKIGCLDWFSQWFNGNYVTKSHIYFDGDGHIIHGLYYNHTYGSTEYVRVGLFPVLCDYSTIENVGLSNVHFVGVSVPDTDPNYLTDTMGAFVGVSEDYDASYKLDSHDAEGNKVKVTSPEFKALALKIKNSFVDHNSYISAYFTGGFIGSPYGAPIIENCLFTGSLGGLEDSYYKGAISGADSTYGTQIKNTIVITPENTGVAGGSNGASWRNEPFEWVTFVEGVYQIGDEVYGGDYVNFASVEDALGSKSIDAMPLLNFDGESDDSWTVIAGRLPIQTIFEKHHTYEQLMSYTCSGSGKNLIGDIYKDGSVNSKDIGLLMQYVNEWDVNINILAADVNDDDKINNKDFGLLMQYLNGWDVELF